MTYGPADPRKLVVRPREGYLVRHPGTGRPLREEGEEIGPEYRAYFLRRLRQGDVEHCAPAIPPKKEA